MNDLEAKSIGELIRNKQSELAETIVERIYSARPQLEIRYGAAGRDKCLQDNHYHLQFLAESLSAESPLLFQDYVTWAMTMLSSHHVPMDDFKLNLELMRNVLQERLPEKARIVVSVYLYGALMHFPRMPEPPAPLLLDESPHAKLASEYLNILLHGDRHGASQMIMESVEKGVDIRDIYMHVFQPCQQEIGRLWQINQVNVAQEHFFTASTQMIMSQLYPRIFSSKKSGQRLVATSVNGELHEIGVRMVADFLEMEGWDTYYLGANMPAESIMQAIEERQAHVIAVSVTISFHVSRAAELIKKIRSSSPKSLKIMVGGYPFNLASGLWNQIGADGYAGDAREAVSLAGRLAQG